MDEDKMDVRPDDGLQEAIGAFEAAESAANVEDDVAPDGLVLPGGTRMRRPTMLSAWALSRLSSLSLPAYDRVLASARILSMSDVELKDHIARMRSLPPDGAGVLSAEAEDWLIARGEPVDAVMDAVTRLMKDLKPQKKAAGAR